MESKHRIQITVNEEEHDLLVHPNKTLLDLLRYDLGLTGTKEGCDEGDCGRLHGYCEWQGGDILPCL